MFAVEVQFAIMLFDELEGLAQLVFGKNPVLTCEKYSSQTIPQATA